jgi:hypothetical protein
LRRHVLTSMHSRIPAILLAASIMALAIC